MKTRYVAWSLVLLGTFLSGFAIADSKNYNGTNDTYVVGPCANPGVGTVCFPPGHISGGQAVLRIDDDFINPVSGVYCQDLNWNGNCADDATTDGFCDHHPIEAGTNWNPALPVYVLIDGEVRGSVAFTPCVGGLSTAGTRGIVDHTEF